MRHVRAKTIYMPQPTREACAKLKVFVALYMNVIDAAPIPIQLEYAIAFTSKSSRLITKYLREAEI